MSLILEALKKSEQQRRLGEAPGLGTPIVLARRRRSLLPVFATAILIALGAGWYLLRDKPQATPDTETAASATLTPRDAAPAASPAAAPKPAAAKPAPARTPADARQSTLVPDRKIAPLAPPVLPVTRPDDRPGSVTPPPVPAAGNTVAEGAGKTHDRPEPPGPASPLEQAPKSAAAPPPTASARPGQKPAPAPASAPKPAAPALPSVWELPYATRKDLPAIDLTMHVYADDAADRFVVVKGERHAEGDQIADGVTLKQITADGMVLEFKGQTFTFPRDSR